MIITEGKKRPTIMFPVSDLPDFHPAAVSLYRKSKWELVAFYNGAAY